MSEVAVTTVEPSPFDAAHYGRRVGRLVLGDDPPDRAIEEARAGGYEVVFARVRADTPARAWFDAAGHAVVDELVTSTLPPDAPVPAGPADVAIRGHVVVDDDALLRAIAEVSAESLTRSHLHADPRLPAAQTRALYAAWARNDATGRAAQTFTAWLDGAFVGYLAALSTPHASVVDLVAVAPRARGRGVGAALLAAFAAWARARPGEITIGTQADNPALRLYARTGFEPTRTDLTYHLWLVDR